MAGDWIKMRSALLDDPDVLEIAARLDLDPPAVCGRLLAVWGWADSVTADGFIKFGKSSLVDSKAGTTGFAEAMVAVGWLEFKEGGIQFTEWEIHNSKSAKARAQDQKLKQLKREAEKRAKRGDPNAVPVLEQNTGQTAGQKPDRKPDTSSLLFSSSGSPDLERGVDSQGLFDPIPDRAFDESPDRLVEESAFVTQWNKLEAAAGRGMRGLSVDRSRSFWLIRGDPELWAKCQEAMAKMRSGLQNGAKISLQKFLTEETILEIIGGKHDFTPGKSRGSVGLNAVSAAQSQSGGSEEEIGGPQVDL